MHVGSESRICRHRSGLPSRVRGFLAVGDSFSALPTPFETGGLPFDTTCTRAHHPAGAWKLASVLCLGCFLPLSFRAGVLILLIFISRWCETCGNHRHRPQAVVWQASVSLPVFWLSFAPSATVPCRCTWQGLPVQVLLPSLQYLNLWRSQEWKAKTVAK